MHTQKSLIVIRNHQKTSAVADKENSKVKKFYKGLGLAGLQLSLMFAVSSQAIGAPAPLDVHPLSERYPHASLHYFPATAEHRSAWLAVGKNAGIVLLDESLKVLLHKDTKAELLDVRLQQGNESGQVTFMSVLEPGHIPSVFSADLKKGSVSEIAQLPAPDFQIENLCLQRDEAGNLFVYLLDERGIAEHWLVMDHKGGAKARHVRNLPIPPNSKSCRVDDAQSLLYVAEESMGIWAYPASAETAPDRRAIDLTEPFGKLSGGAETLAVIAQGLVTISADDKHLRTYRVDGESVSSGVTLDLSVLEKPESLTSWFVSADQRVNVLVYDDADGKHYTTSFAWNAKPLQPESSAMATVSATVQTAPMSRFGDAADDPAIWINAKKPQRSLVLGTNKKEGLMVYDLQGKLVQSIATGRINNVDVRYGFQLGRKQVDLAIASLRDDNSLALYTIDRRSGKVSTAGKVATDLQDIYGFCMYQAPAQNKQSASEIYAIANDKSGEFQQFLITANERGEISGELVRRFHVKSQPEGCVANDRTRQLFVGEEDVGVWTIGADPDAGTELTSVMKVGGLLVDDVEGLAIYQGKKQDYLVISSQGNDSYIVADTEAPYRVRGAFRIGINTDKNIDAVSETDGLEVTHFDLGGEFSEGILVVQDGHKVMPETPQNFKYVPWRSIREQLKLD